MAAAIRRRRQCPACGARFTTFERVQLRELLVVKKDGRRLPFDRDKLARSIRIATRKRGIDDEQIERIVNGIVRRIETSGEVEVPSTRIGELAMESLAQLDEVAYVRFASVYRDFATVRDFEEFIRQLPEDEEPPAAPPGGGGSRATMSALGPQVHGHGPGPGRARAGQCLAEPGRRLRPGQGRPRRRPRLDPARRPAACRERGDRPRRCGRPRQHGLCHARALRASRPHAALRRA